MSAKFLVCTVIFTCLAVAPVLVSSFDSRIVGGYDALWNQVPWTASIRYIPSDGVFGNGHFCGGTLINNRTILTAAHCLLDNNDRQISPSNIRVVGGNLDRFFRNDTTYVGRASRTVIHRNYNADTLANDIGLILLQDDVPRNHPFFQPINLTTSAIPTNTSCDISGWGHLKFNGSSPAKLQVARVLLYDRNLCRAAYQSVLPPNTICAGVYQGGIDACQGDSGGPLVCNNRLAGVVSSGHECARQGYPGIYTDVTQFASWIAANSSTRISNTVIMMLVSLLVASVFRK